MPDDDKVLDSDLEAALAGNGEENNELEDTDSESAIEGDSTEGETQETEDVDDTANQIDWEKELNKTKSDWGRKQKKLETQIESLTQNVSTLVEALKSKGRDEDGDLGVDEDDPIPLSVGELMQLIDKIQGGKQSKISKAQKKYEGGYLDTVEKMGSQYSDKVHKHIVDRMFKDFNVKHSDNPSLDAQLNFREAEAAILREVRQRKNPLDKNKGKKPDGLGGPTGSDQDSGTSTPLKLDKYAQSFVESMGMEEKDVREALTGDAPMYLRGGVK